MSQLHVPEQRLHEDHRARELSTVYHDLRQCVTAGLLLTDMPHDDLLEPETRRRFSLIRQTLRHAADMLESAATTGARSGDWEVVDLAELAETCATVAEFGHKVRFVTDAAETPLVRTDALLLRRAIDNMIDNAGRAAGPDGDVVIRVGTAGEEAWVEVVDDGPGFGEIRHGTGRGLGVVSDAARRSGGRLEISSGPGPGTTVRMAFPRVAEE